MCLLTVSVDHHVEDLVIETRRLCRPFCCTEDVANKRTNVVIKRVPRADHLLKQRTIKHSFIHSRIYKAPLQETYSRAPQAQSQQYRSVLSNQQNTLYF